MAFLVIPIWRRRKNESQKIEVSVLKLPVRKKMIIDHSLFSFNMPVVLKLCCETGLLETDAGSHLQDFSGMSLGRETAFLHF